MDDIKLKPLNNKTFKSELANRFVSILLTAVVSALITFLQSLLLEPITSIPPHEQVETAAGIGASIRSVMEFTKIKKHV